MRGMLIPVISDEVVDPAILWWTEKLFGPHSMTDSEIRRLGLSRNHEIAVEVGVSLIRESPRSGDPATFRKVLRDYLRNPDTAHNVVGFGRSHPYPPCFRLEVDYHPLYGLLEASEACGEGSGFGLFPFKTQMDIFPDHIEVNGEEIFRV